MLNVFEGAVVDVELETLEVLLHRLHLGMERRHVDFDLLEPLEVGLHLPLDLLEPLVIDGDFDPLKHLEAGLHLNLELLDLFELRFDPGLRLFHLGQDLLELGAGGAWRRVAGHDRSQGGDHRGHQDRGGQENDQPDAAVIRTVENAHDAFLQMGSARHSKRGDCGRGARGRMAGDAQ